MNRANVLISPTRLAPTTAIKKIVPQYDCDFKKCEVTLNIGLFFDGTNNNKDRDSASHANSNIARLYDLYNSDKMIGYHRIYIPGVGTSFPDIGEHGESKLGAGCAIGCEARVIFGLLTVLNSMHQRCFQKSMFNKESILALCRNSLNVIDSDDRENLAKLDTSSGLLQMNLGSNNNRANFLKRQAQSLRSRLKDVKPRIIECFIDVFGFSRGAAEARVFCNWLNDLLIDGKLAGVPVQFRFIGIFDTVASAGFWSGASAMVSNSTGGHGAWASAESLNIPASVKNCVHMVAMHELRRNFPLDEIGVDGKMQSGWIQHAYPGAHSDVGGGYRPGELGVSVGDDSLKLSQIPLNHMLDCAIAAGVPMKRPPASTSRYNPVAIHPELAKAYDDFITESTLTPRPMYEWLQPYLNWRWQVRKQFHTTRQVKLASKEDQDILIAFNNSLISDADAMMRSAAMSISKRTVSVVTDIFNIGARKDLLTTTALEAEAREVLALAQRARQAPPSFVALFDGYVHDSLAGFNSPTLELTGYWRYRRVFLGSDEYTIAANQDINTTRNLV